MSITRRHLVQATVASSLTARLPLRHLHAQGSIDTLRIIVGFPPGGTTDAFARRIADKLRGTYATNAVVDNKPGAGGQVGVTTLQAAAPDGAHVLFTPGSMITIYPHTYPRLPYKAADVVPVSTGIYTAFGFGVGPQVPANVTNLKEFAAWVRANPGMGNYGTPGAGSMPHMVGALFDKAENLGMKQVPYRGSGPGIGELIGGQIACFTSPIGDYLQHIGPGGKLRLLATTGKTRTPYTPQVPTYAEQGYSELTMEEWFGFFLPKGTPAAVANRLNAALKTAIAAPDVATFARPIGLVPTASASPDDFARTVKADGDLWGGYVRKIGFTAES